MIVAAGGGERDLDVDSAVLTARADGRSGALNERLMNDLRPTLFLAQLSKAPSVLQLCEIGTRPSYGAGNDRHAIVRIHLGSGKYPLAPGTQPTGG